MLMDNGSSSFAFKPNVSGFEDLSNTHIDTAFANLPELRLRVKLTVTFLSELPLAISTKIPCRDNFCQGGQCTHCDSEAR